MSVTLKQLEAFLAVADLASFRRAAERLNTTQPNISTRIASLEGLLGVKLMERDAGSVRLTPRGAALLPHARHVIQSMDALLGAAGDDALFDGVIRLGVTEMVAHTWLGTFLKALQTRFPNVSVQLSVDMSVNVSEALFARVIDLALQNGPFPRVISGQVDLGSYPLIWVAAPELGVGQREMSLADFAAFTVLTHAKGAQPHEQLMQHLADNDAREVRLATSTNLAACRQMTIDGLGIACLPRAMVARDLADGALQQVRYPWTPDALEFSARFDADTAPSFVRRAAEIAGEIAARSSTENINSLSQR